MKNPFVAVAVGLVILAGTAQADTLDLTEVRQTSMDLVGATYAGLRGAVAGDTDIKKLENSAKALARFAKVYPSMFAAGTEKGHDTRALPAIWSDSAGFEKAAANLRDTAMKLAEVARSGDATAFTAQLQVVGDACSTCHKAYRAK